MQWDLSDGYLQRVLGQGLYFYGGQTWYCHLYQNNLVPFPGITLDDFVECDYPDYVRQFVDTSAFPYPTVVDHVAISTSTQVVTFTAASSGFTEQLVYGYWVTDDDDNYLFCERFIAPITMRPDGEITIQPRLRHRTEAE